MITALGIAGCSEPAPARKVLPVLMPARPFGRAISVVLPTPSAAPAFLPDAPLAPPSRRETAG